MNEEALNIIFGLVFKNFSLFEIYKYFNFDVTETMRFLAVFSDTDKNISIKIPSQKSITDAIKDANIYNILEDKDKDEFEQSKLELASQYNTTTRKISSRYTAYKRHLKGKDSDKIIQLLNDIKEESEAI